MAAQLNAAAGGGRHMTIHGARMYLTNDEVKTLFVPQYKNLSIERILEFIADKPHIHDFLPDEIEKSQKILKIK